MWIRMWCWLIIVHWLWYITLRWHLMMLSWTHAMRSIRWHRLLLHVLWWRRWWLILNLMWILWWYRNILLLKLLMWWRLRLRFSALLDVRWMEKNKLIKIDVRKLINVSKQESEAKKHKRFYFYFSNKVNNKFGHVSNRISAIYLTVLLCSFHYDFYFVTGIFEAHVKCWVNLS